MLLAAIGMSCLGFVIAYLCMYFVVRLKEHTVAGLSGVAGVLVGGVVGKFLTANTSAGPDSIWWYPIGLLIGLVAWVLLRVVDPESRLRRAAEPESPVRGPARAPTAYTRAGPPEKRRPPSTRQRPPDSKH